MRSPRVLIAPQQPAGWRRNGVGISTPAQLDPVCRALDAPPAHSSRWTRPCPAARVGVALSHRPVEEVGDSRADAAQCLGLPDTHLMALCALHVATIRGMWEEPPACWRRSPRNTGYLFIATVHRLVQGISSMWLGDADRARELLLLKAARRAEGHGNRLAYIYAQGRLAPLARARRPPPTSRGLAGSDARVCRRPPAQRLGFRGHVPGPGLGRASAARRGNCPGSAAPRGAHGLAAALAAWSCRGAAHRVGGLSGPHRPPLPPVIDGTPAASE